MANGRGSQLAIITLDASKAFDKVNWAFLFRTLEANNLGGNFVKILKLSYSRPSARLVINGEVSTPILIEKGTRQGCPLSPLLFDLYMEPLANQLRRDQGIAPFWGEGWSKKIAIYADDLLIYTSDLTAALPRISQIVESFGRVSGYVVNPDKSEIMLWNHPIPRAVMPDLIKDRIRYLGVIISHDLSKIPELNWQRKLVEVKQLLKIWSRLPLMIYGGVNIVKMTILPKFTFLLILSHYLLNRGGFVDYRAKLTALYGALKLLEYHGKSCAGNRVKEG